MPDIELYQPTDEANALALGQTGNDGWLLGGGQSYGWLKDRNKSATAMIELTRSMLKGSETADGIEIGAVTTLTEIANNGVRVCLPKPLALVASPQIRKRYLAATWYHAAAAYRRGLDCYRAGGNICYADSRKA
ncbi:MAG: FAD binding domain-containing protein [Pseudohongiellaceae bacterium]